METVVSGIRSTGNLHLGNYFGALRNFVKMQHTERCFFFIADYHSLTTHPDPNMLHVNVKNVLSEYLAAGLDPEAATIYVQSDVPEVAELSLLLSMHAYVASWNAPLRSKTRSASTPTTSTSVC
jgi:tryptophanyl-tRNA synthetase